MNNKTIRNSRTKKKVIEEYYCDIYDVILVIANEYVELEDLQKLYVYYDGIVLEESIMRGSATTSRCKRIKDDANVSLVKLNIRNNKKDKTKNRLDLINTYSHEAVHVALDIYELISQNVCFCTPEPFCYLVGWATERIYKTLGI